MLTPQNCRSPCNSEDVSKALCAATRNHWRPLPEAIAIPASDDCGLLYVNHPGRAHRVRHPQLPHTRPDSAHKLLVMRLKPALQTGKLEPSVPPPVGWNVV